MSGNTLEDAIPTLSFDGTHYHCARCGNSQIFLCRHWNDLFFRAHAAINCTYLGRESNEGEKLARRNVAVDAIRFAMRAGPGLTLKEVDKVIQEAQG